VETGVLVKGYRLQIGPYGQVPFETDISEKWISCVSADKTIPLRKWTCLVGVYKARKEIALYVNGKLVSTVAIKNSLTNPAFVITSWGKSKSKTEVRLNGNILKEGSDYFVGWRLLLTGLDMILFIKTNHEEKTEISINNYNIGEKILAGS